MVRQPPKNTHTDLCRNSVADFCLFLILGVSDLSLFWLKKRGEVKTETSVSAFKVSPVVTEKHKLLHGEILGGAKEATDFIATLLQVRMIGCPGSDR